MKFFDNLLGKIKQKTNRFVRNYVSSSFYSESLGLVTPNDFYSMVNAYKSWVYICSTRNSINVASIPLKLYLSRRRNSKKSAIIETKAVDRVTKNFIFNSPSLYLLDPVKKAISIEEVVDHPFLTLLKNVNSHMNRFDLMESTELYLELIGNSYWYIYKNDFGIPQEIWLLPGHQVTVVPDKEKFVKGYVFRNGLQAIPFDASEIIHFKFPSPTNLYYGSSPLSAVISAFNTNENISRYADSMFKNMGMPEGILWTEQELSEEEFERMKAIWKETYGGVGNVGKGHPYGTHILTTKGWKKIEDLKIGDHLFSQDGSSTRLQGKFYRGEQQCYKFTFNDYSSIETDEEHLWNVKTSNERSHKKGFIELSTKEIFEYYNSRDITPQNKYTIPVNLPVQFSHKKVSIDPYTLGCLLGDGYLYKKNKTKAVYFSTAEPEMLENMKVKYKHNDRYSYRISGIANQLDDLNLLGKLSHTKFIPDDYLYNSIKSRHALLQGLMDTDGCIARDGQIVFTTTSPYLRDGVMFLVRSLGGDCSYRCYQRVPLIVGERITHPRLIYNVRIRLNNFNPFKLKRKANMVRHFPKTFEKRIVSVEKIDTKPTICLSVEHESGLYIAKDFIVTHNTAVLEKGLQYKPISFTPRELGFLIGRKMTIQEIAGAYGIPVSKMTADNVNLANAYVGERQYQKDTLLPRLRRIEEKLNEQLIPLYDGNIFCAFDNPIAEDKELELREREINLRTGYSNINELRSREGLPPVEWGDDPILPSGSLPFRSSGQIDNLAQQIANSIRSELMQKRKV